MAWNSKALATKPEDPGSVPGTTCIVACARAYTLTLQHTLYMYAHMHTHITNFFEDNDWTGGGENVGGQGQNPAGR